MHRSLIQVSFVALGSKLKFSEPRNYNRSSRERVIDETTADNNILLEAVVLKLKPLQNL